jgi:hypothetical protein
MRGLLNNLRAKDLPGLALAPGNIPNAVFLSHDKPVDRPVRDRVNDHRIEDAMKHEMFRQGLDDTPLIGKAHFSQPVDRMQGALDILQGNVHKYGSNKLQNLTINGQNLDVNKININPNADEVFLFHELGHIANRQSGFGKQIRNLRQRINDGDDQMLRNSLIAATALAPGVATALIPGDEDAGVAMALAGAASAPGLIDEVMASNTGLRMMETAGTRANLGQRGKLAGSLLSYLAPVIGTGLASGMAGNMFD